MIKIFGFVKKHLAPKQKSDILCVYININIVPKKVPSDAILRCFKASISDRRCFKSAPKLFTQHEQPAAVLKKISHLRLFHTSDVRRATPSLVAIILRPLIKLAAILFGRSLRKWWQSLPPEKKQAVINKLHEYKVYIIGVLSVMSFTTVHFYISHLEQDPLTKRWKFVIFTHEQMMQIADVELEVLVEEFEGCFLHANNRDFKLVTKVANRILDANQDIQVLKDTKWQVCVVDHPLMINAFVLPNGTIFIFTGLLELCDNDDQLGLVLAHEMSHALLDHMAEQMSEVQLIEWLIIIPLVIFWTLMPDGAALFSQWVSEQFAKILFHLPFSRFIEAEADKFGLQLAAKACFDVREASAFWNKMSEIDKESGQNEISEWLSTHPKHDTREAFLESMMHEMLLLREKCNCPKLPQRDPRAAREANRKKIADKNNKS